MRRTWLLERLGGYLEFQRNRMDDVLSLTDEALIALWAEVAQRRGIAEQTGSEHQRFGHACARARRAEARDAGLELICACEDAYPERLRRLFGPPAVLHVAGGMARFLALAREEPVAIVGARRATLYGTDVAGRLGRGVSASGLTVVSGMAIGIDAAAHRGAIAAGGRTIAVLPGGAAQPYPKANRHLYERILSDGVAVSELGPAASVRRWTLIARNRLIAGLSQLTVVVQGTLDSGALRTADLARRAGSRLGAVPGSVLVAQSAGPHKLLREGAVLVRDAQDVLDAVCGAGERTVADPASAMLSGDQRAVFDAIAAGADTPAALSRCGLGGEPLGAGRLLSVLAELELAGCVRRAPGGRYVVVMA